jgi:hypothetical protein
MRLKNILRRIRYLKSNRPGPTRRCRRHQRGHLHPRRWRHRGNGRCGADIFHVPGRSRQTLEPVTVRVQREASRANNLLPSRAKVAVVVEVAVPSRLTSTTTTAKRFDNWAPAMRYRRRSLTSVIQWRGGFGNDRQHGLNLPYIPKILRMTSSSTGVCRPCCRM